LGETFADPGATATDPEDGALPVTADCTSVDASRSGRYTCTYRATDSAGNTTSAGRTVVVGADTACASATSVPASHIAAGRAVTGGWFNLRALANADQQDIGFAWDYYWFRVTLYEGDPGRWYAHVPETCHG